MEQPIDLSSFANSLTQAGRAMDIVDGVKTLSGFYVIASTDNGKPHAYARLQTHESPHQKITAPSVRPTLRRSNSLNSWPEAVRHVEREKRIR